jgi:hypothetical protein
MARREEKTTYGLYGVAANGLANCMCVYVYVFMLCLKKVEELWVEVGQYKQFHKLI